jgi:cytochrome c biogenesis protein CcmG/thiol:disulfide interchange protein DsbE
VAVVAALLAGLSAALMIHGFGHPPPTLVGTKAPAIALETTSGEIGDRTLAGRPMVVNFWASWCAGCVAEQPVLDQASIANPEVAFLGVAIQDSSSDIAAYETDHPHSYPIGPASSGSYLDFGVTAPPETFFLDGRGTIVGHVIGPLDPMTLRVNLDRASR